MVWSQTPPERAQPTLWSAHGTSSCAVRMIRLIHTPARVCRSAISPSSKVRRLCLTAATPRGARPLSLGWFLLLLRPSKWPSGGFGVADLFLLEVARDDVGCVLAGA